MNLVLDRVLQHLNEDVKDVINQANLSKLIAIYNSVMQQKQHHLTSLTPSATELVQEIILLLQEEVLSEFFFLNLMCFQILFYI